MERELWVMKEFGFRYWLAYILVRAAHRIKDTTYHQVIRISDRSAVLVDADTWGGGVMATTGVGWEFRDICDPEWPFIRDFDNFDEALTWMYEKEDNECRNA